MPILHQSRYLSWSSQPDKKLSRICLQSAMWTLAALVSMQFQHFQGALYQETKQHLDSLSSFNDSNGFTADTERLQALVLTAVFEVMRAYHQQAWMSTGQAFRLAQLMRFHEIDHHDNFPLPDRNNTEAEEQRRAFWMAFVLENILSIRNRLPVSLNAHLVENILPF
jgi:Fungal specific transcription factor domain